MKRVFTLAAAVCLLLAACSKTDIKENEQFSPSDDATAGASAKKAGTTSDLGFSEAGLFPEGVVYDKFNDRFYVSSTTTGDIGIVNSDGSYTPFITDPALVATAGLEIDEARKLLYAANSTDGSVGVFNLSTGQRVAIIDLKPLSPGAGFFINDLSIDPQGNVYATNSAAPVIYKITPGGEASIFYQDPTFATTGFGFNGIEYANQGFLLVAHTARNEVIKFPIRNPADYSIVNFNQALNRPDGLLLNDNGKELVVVNNAGGANGKVVLFSSKNQWQSGAATTTFETGPVFPTTATSAGKEVFVLYAYLNRRSTEPQRADYTIKKLPGFDKF